MSVETTVVSSRTATGIAAEINSLAREGWQLAGPVQGVRSLSAAAEYEAVLFTATLQREATP